MMIGAEQDTGGGGFLPELIRRLREAEGESGESDFALLAPLVIPRARAAAQRSGRPDPEVFWRIDAFHAAVGATIERRTGVRCQPMLRMHHDGFGRVVLLAGRLVVVSRILDDVQAFGFESVEALAEAGERLVADAVEWIERFPEVAHAGP
jgi:probable nitrogen fixation protein